VAERPTHGYAVAKLLGEDGPIGRVWTLHRNEVYNTLNRLTRRELISEGDIEQSERGPDRTLLRATPAGKRLLRRWLVQPVDHVRDVRTLLLLKLLLLERSGGDPASLIDAQKTKLIPVLDGLEARRERANGFDWILAQWRTTSCRATLEFLSRLQA
jgi:PadR family transcriptional regulator AphA